MKRISPYLIIGLSILSLAATGIVKKSSSKDRKIKKFELSIAEPEVILNRSNILVETNNIKEVSWVPKGSKAWIEGTKGWAQSGDSLYPLNNNWSVGIGTTSPDERLDVRGVVLGHGSGGNINGVSSLNKAGIIGVTGMSIGLVAGYGAVSGFMQSTSTSHAGLYARVYDNATGLIVARITGSGDIALFRSVGSPDALVIKNDGKVGIGIASPQRTLHIKDVLRLEPQTTPPAGEMGDLYVGTDGKLYFHDGTAWNEVALVP